MRIYITSALYTAIFLWLFYLVLILNRSVVYAENGLLENIQVLTLLATCIIFFIPTISQKREDKLILLFFSFLSLAFILREIDVERLDVSSILVFIGSGIGRNTLLGIGFIAIFAYAIVNHTYYKKFLKPFFTSKGGVLLVLAGIFLLIGDRFENYDTMYIHVFIEEMFELLGYLFMLLSALIFSKNRLLVT